MTWHVSDAQRAQLLERLRAKVAEERAAAKAAGKRPSRASLDAAWLHEVEREVEERTEALRVRRSYRNVAALAANTAGDVEQAKRIRALPAIHVPDVTEQEEERQRLLRHAAVALKPELDLVEGEAQEVPATSPASPPDVL